MNCWLFPYFILFNHVHCTAWVPKLQPPPPPHGPNVYVCVTFFFRPGLRVHRSCGLVLKTCSSLLSFLLIGSPETVTLRRGTNSKILAVPTSKISFDLKKAKMSVMSDELCCFILYNRIELTAPKKKKNSHKCNIDAIMVSVFG